MRQQDNLPAFWRVHRNGRPLIGKIATLTARERTWQTTSSNPG
jgi:hypothetical protein